MSEPSGLLGRALLGTALLGTALLETALLGRPLSTGARLDSTEGTALLGSAPRAEDRAPGLVGYCERALATLDGRPLTSEFRALLGSALLGSALLGTALLGTALLGAALLGAALLGTALLGRPLRTGAKLERTEGTALLGSAAIADDSGAGLDGSCERALATFEGRFPMREPRALLGTALLGMTLLGTALLGRPLRIGARFESTDGTALLGSAAMAEERGAALDGSCERALATFEGRPPIRELRALLGRALLEAAFDDAPVGSPLRIGPRFERTDGTALLGRPAMAEERAAGFDGSCERALATFEGRLLTSDPRALLGRAADGADGTPEEGSPAEGRPVEGRPTDGAVGTAGMANCEAKLARLPGTEAEGRFVSAEARAAGFVESWLASCEMTDGATLLGRALASCESADGMAADGRPDGRPADGRPDDGSPEARPLDGAPGAPEDGSPATRDDKAGAIEGAAEASCDRTDGRAAEGTWDSADWRGTALEESCESAFGRPLRSEFKALLESADDTPGADEGRALLRREPTFERADASGALVETRLPGLVASRESALAKGPDGF